MPWQPTTILRLEEALPTGAGVFRVVTDAGKGYLKTLGNPAGTRALICEWIAWRLARKLKLPTFDAAIVSVTGLDELQFAKGGFAEPGPAFITRAENGTVWGGTETDLKRLVNPEDLMRLVVFDTWLRNRDRCPPPGTAWHINRRNVFLALENMPEGKMCLKAMDHTHCLTWASELTAKIAGIDEWQDERVYGRFIEFEPWLSRERVRGVLADLSLITQEDVSEILAALPSAWLMDGTIRKAVIDFVVSRAGWLVDNMESLLWPQKEFKI